MAPTTQRAYRLPEDLVKRIDEYKRRLESQAVPGTVVNETQLVIHLLNRALDVEDAERQRMLKRRK